MRLLFQKCLFLTALLFLSDRAIDCAEHPGHRTDENLDYFENNIRPLFVQQCQSCHGPQKQKGGLRLDSAESIQRGGESGRIIEPGHPEKSLLYKAVTYHDDQLKMPPRGKLSVEQIEHVRQWIIGGAALPKDTQSKPLSRPLDSFDLQERLKHWSYQPLKNSVLLPAQDQSTDILTTIDPFIQSKWKELGLHGAGNTDKRTWLRRVSFDLIGLPPTVDEIEAFEKDADDSAYHRVVDQLMNRSEYGERWARHWLDLMRYADTLGHEFDFDLPHAWRYRNYLVRAFNTDVPYDQFVLEHLAGDLFPKPRMNLDEHWNESIQATAFLWLGEAKQAPVDVRQEQADRIDNQIDVMGKAFLGQTLACARCHDHKFDAIATRDYYALYGVLKSSRYQQACIDDPVIYQQSLHALYRIHQDIENHVKKMNLHDQFSTVEHISQQSTGKTTESSVPGQRFSEINLASATTQGMAWKWTTTPTIAVFIDPKTKKECLRAVPANVWDSGILSNRLEGSLRTSTFDIDQRYLHIEAAGIGARIRIVIDGFAVIRDPIYGGLRKVLNNPLASHYTFDLGMWKGRQAYIEFLDGGPADLSLGEESGKNDAWLQILGIAKSDDIQPNGGKKRELAVGRQFLQPLDTHAWWAKLQEQRQAIEKQIPQPRYALATADGNGLDEHVFIRGSHRSPGEKVPRGLSTVFCGISPVDTGTGSGRLALAKRLVNPQQNPLIARVIVNRIWKHHFGQGLVRSVDDLGRMGEHPSHPELLDYLAAWFVKHGWSMKKLHRELVLSRTYRQSCVNSDEQVNHKDPQNRWLTRMPMRRLEAEAIRDSILAVSGRLQKGQADSGVMPYLTNYMQGRGRPSIVGPLDGHGKRSIYLSIRRNFLPPLFTAFDYPTPFSTIGRRSTANLPAQSLALMNDPFVYQQAQLWSKRLIEQQATLKERLLAMYQTAFGRLPDVTEEQLVKDFLQQRSNVDETQAWTELAHALFCSKEFIFVR